MNAMLPMGVEAQVCAEPGRQMFYHYLGRYFASQPNRREMPQGTPCSVCGATSMRLWESSVGDGACPAQQAITAKRAGRKQASDPGGPALPGTSGMTAMGDGNFAIAGPHVAKLVTKLLPTKVLPPNVELIFSDKGVTRKTKLALLHAPPKPPFVVVSFEKKADYPIAITADPSRIIINGPKGAVLDTPRLKHLIALYERIGGKALGEMIALRFRLAGGDTKRKFNQHEVDQEALLELRGSNLITPAEFRRLPSMGTPEVNFLRGLDED